MPLAVTIRFENGGVAAVTLGGIGVRTQKESPQIDIVTANGQAHLSGREHIWERLSWATRDVGATQNILQSPEALGNTRYTDAFTYFLDCVRHNREPSVGINDGITAVALAMAVVDILYLGQLRGYLFGDRSRVGDRP